MMTSSLVRSFLGYFVEHRVAANILLIVSFVLGWYAFNQINVKLLPDYQTNLISISVHWPQSNVESVERFLIDPIEREVRGIPGIETVKSSARADYASVDIKFKSNVDMVKALLQVKDSVDLVREWPDGAKEPKVKERESFSLVTSILVWADANWYELKYWVQAIEQGLFRLGLDRIETVGLSDEELVVELPSAYLQTSGDSFERIANWVAGQNVGELSLGDYYQPSSRYQLTIDSDYYHPHELSTMPIKNKLAGWSLLSDDLAVRFVRKKGQAQLFFDNMPAVAFMVMAGPDSHTFRLVDLVDQWSNTLYGAVPEVIQFKLYNQIWQYIDGRITLMLSNGLQGLLLIALVVWFFLRLRILRWVILGIPISFSLSLFLLWMVGETINQISLFGFIMALGIVVDDTIVVCEAIIQLYEDGESPLDAVIGGVSFIGGAIIVSSLTTVAAFLPLIILSGAMGDILTAIPTVVIVVILASLVECFLILPRHMYQDLQRFELGSKTYALRHYLDKQWVFFRDHRMLRAVAYLLDRPSIAIGLIVSLLLLTTALCYSGHLAFTFFPSVPGQDIYADVRFVSGTTPDKMMRVLSDIELGLDRLKRKHGLGQDVVEMSYRNMHQPSMYRSARGQWGDQYLQGNVYARLIPMDQRDFDNETFIEWWHDEVVQDSAIDLVTIEQPRDGPPSQDIMITYVGEDLDELKQAALATEARLADLGGVINIEDNMPYDVGVLVFTMKPAALELGLSAESIVKQVLPITRGVVVGVDRTGADDVVLRLSLPEYDSDLLEVLYTYPIQLEGGGRIALSSLVNFDKVAGFDQVRHYQGNRVINVLADVDTRVANRNQVLRHIKSDVIPEVLAQFNVTVDYSDQSRMESETLREMKYGLVVGVVLIYFLLAWSFSSFLMPLLIMMTMPLSLIGALWGHYLLGFDVSILSLMGFFGLMGIIVNDSIILIKTYQVLVMQGLGRREAVLGSVSKRLRPVILTTLTTVLGLSPLIFESSYQAQFLIPMAISITFGLFLGTVLVFLLVPVLLYRLSIK